MHGLVSNTLWLSLLLYVFQPQSMIIGLLKEMAIKFEEELPLYSLSSSDAARQMELLSYIAKFTEGVHCGETFNLVFIAVICSVLVDFGFALGFLFLTTHACPLLSQGS